MCLFIIAAFTRLCVIRLSKGGSDQGNLFYEFEFEVQIQIGLRVAYAEFCGVVPQGSTGFVSGVFSTTNHCNVVNSVCARSGSSSDEPKTVFGMNSDARFSLLRVTLSLQRPLDTSGLSHLQRNKRWELRLVNAEQRLRVYRQLSQSEVKRLEEDVAYQLDGLYLEVFLDEAHFGEFSRAKVWGQMKSFLLSSPRWHLSVCIFICLIREGATGTPDRMASPRLLYSPVSQWIPICLSSDNILASTRV